MPLFRISNNKLATVKEVVIRLEKDIQAITEGNLDEIFELKFIKHEFQLNSLRVDTLAFDEESNSFVIIEYKRDRSFSVIDQGYAYLSLMLNNKAEFILEYNESQKNTLTRGAIDWTQSRVIFIANSFTTHQQNAINFKDLPIELWEYKKYENDTILYSQIKSDKNAESINVISSDQSLKKVTNEVKSYSLSDHFKVSWDASKAMFEEISEAILSIDSRIEERPVKNYIGYRIDNKVFCNIKVMKSKLLLELYRVRPGDLNDPENRTTYVKDSKENYNKHVTKFDINSSIDIQYGLMLAKQVFSKTY